MAAMVSLVEPCYVALASVGLGMVNDGHPMGFLQAIFIALVVFTYAMKHCFHVPFCVQHGTWRGRTTATRVS